MSDRLGKIPAAFLTALGLNKYPRRGTCYPPETGESGLRAKERNCAPPASVLAAQAPRLHSPLQRSAPPAPTFVARPHHLHSPL